MFCFRGKRSRIHEQNVEDRRIAMEEIKRIALVAHDNRKKDLIE
jgi:hypothetical protein